MPNQPVTHDSVTLAVDAMGGDHGPQVTVPAVDRFLRRHPTARVVLVGRPDVLEAAVAATGMSRDRVRIHPASEVVAMDESPALALKNKKDSSMRVAINLVKQGEASACVSAGNTGALMATARFVLKTLPGIDRPAIAKLLPARHGQTCMLDLGANVDCTPEHLVQFAVMGSMLISALTQQPNPTVGLLNIGSEDIKGNDQVKQAAELLRDCPLNYQGNVEGDDIYSGRVDVVVCDGFVGNVALKSSEGIAKLLMAYLREEFSRSWWTRLLGVAALPVLKALKRRVDPRRFNGASLLGLRGIVVKSHGSADVFSFECALDQAMHEATSGVLEKISNKVGELLAVSDQRSARAPEDSPAMPSAAHALETPGPTPLESSPQESAA